MKLKNTVILKPTHTDTHHCGATIHSVVCCLNVVFIKRCVYRKQDVCVCVCVSCMCMMCVFNGGKSDAPRAQLRPSGNRFPCFHSNPCPITAAALHYSGSVSVRWSHFSAACVHACVYVRQCLCASIRDSVLYGCLSSLHPNVCAESFSSSTSPPTREEKASISLCSGAWRKKKNPSLM